MSWHSTYEAARQFADSWGLLAMTLMFLTLAAWPFRPGGKQHNQRAANLIFEDREDG